jgi:hypothetical protein
MSDIEYQPLHEHGTSTLAEKGAFSCTRAKVVVLVVVCVLVAIAISVGVYFGTRPSVTITNGVTRSQMTCTSVQVTEAQCMNSGCGHYSTASVSYQTGACTHTCSATYLSATECVYYYTPTLTCSVAQIPNYPVVMPCYLNSKIATGCFPADAEVVANGRSLVISQLQIGDKVLDAKGSQTTFIGWLKRSSSSAIETTDLHYRRLDNSTATLSLTGNHLVYLQDGNPVQAKYVKPGDHLMSGGIVQASHRSIKMGVFVPNTLSGSLSVDGVLVSIYAGIEADDVPLVHAILSPMRLLYHVLPSSWYAVIADTQDGWHWFPGTLNNLWASLLSDRPLVSLFSAPVSF